MSAASERVDLKGLAQLVALRKRHEDAAAADFRSERETHDLAMRALQRAEDGVASAEEARRAMEDRQVAARMAGLLNPADFAREGPEREAAEEAIERAVSAVARAKRVVRRTAQRRDIAEKALQEARADHERWREMHDEAAAAQTALAARREEADEEEASLDRIGALAGRQR